MYSATQGPRHGECGPSKVWYMLPMDIETTGGCKLHLQVLGNHASGTEVLLFVPSPLRQSLQEAMTTLTPLVSNTAWPHIGHVSLAVSGLWEA